MIKYINGDKERIETLHDYISFQCELFQNLKFSMSRVGKHRYNKNKEIGEYIDFFEDDFKRVKRMLNKIKPKMIEYFENQ